MKFSLRKSILAIAALALAGSAYAAPTLKQVMHTTTDVVANLDGRFSTGSKGYVYINDKANGQVVRYDVNGAKSVFASVEGVGTGITSDDAGNIIVNKDFPNSGSSNTFVIIEPDGTQHELNVTFPDEVSPARCDAFGRVLGNVMSEEGAYMYITTNGNDKVVAVKIANGAQDGDALASIAIGFNFDTTSVAQPALSSVEDVDAAADPSMTCYARKRGDLTFWAPSEDGTEWIKHPAADGARSCDGFDVFSYKDVLYSIDAVTANNYGDGFVIRKYDDGEIVATYEETFNPGGARYQSFVARNEDDVIRIYRHVSGELVDIFEFAEEEAPESKLYVIGEINGKSWAPNDGVEMTLADGAFSADITVSGAAGFFSFVTDLAENNDQGGWDYVNELCYGAANDGDVASTEAANALVKGSNAYQLPTGEYTLSVKEDLSEFTVTVKGEPVPTYPDELYILGEVNENTWAPNVGLMMTPADSKSLTGEFIASFKADGRNDGYNYLSFSSKLAENADDWAGIADSRYGAEVNNIDVVLDEAMAIQKGENAFKIAAGEYNVEVNLSAGTVKFSAVPVVGPSAPVINPNGGTFENEVTVTITAEEADEIRYTLDGSTPDATSTLYAEPIVLNEVGTHTVKAIALKNGLVSDAVEAEFTITNGGGGGGEMKLTKIWEYKTSGNPANTDARFATGFDGKVYVADKAAGEVKVYDADGAKSYAAVEGMGAAITSDDAGNILVNKGFPGATSFNDWVIIKPDGTQTALTIAAPDGVTAARTDQVGRIVGDVMSADGGYMYLAANGQGSVAAIKIANGEQDAEASLASPATGLALNTSFIAQPACETVEDVEAAVDASATFYIRNRTDHKILGWNEDGTELTSLGTVGGGTCEGFDYFFYNDEMYAVAALARTFQFQLKNMTTGEVIAEEGDADALANQFRAYTVRKEGENKFGIYIWNAGGGAAYYVYGKTEGVESVAAESEVVATSYYNLQGVRVNNPAAGQILIKVNTLSNGKISASKVLVR